MRRVDLAAARAKFAGQPCPPHLKHSPDNVSRIVYGCDCRKCLPSGRAGKGRGPLGDVAMPPIERQRKLRKAKKGQPVPEGTKHGIYAAKIYRCKCDVCRKALAVRAHRRKNPWMYRRTRGHWGQAEGANGPVDVLWWPAEGQSIDACPIENCFHIDHKKETAS